LDAPQLPPGQAPPRKGSCPGGRPSGPAAAAGYFTEESIGYSFNNGKGMKEC